MSCRGAMALVSAAWLLGCGGDETPTRPDQSAHAVWSDDDQAIAVAFDWIDEDFFHEVLLAHPTGDLRERLVGPRRGSVWQLFFMREAGYVLLVGAIDSSPTSFTTFVDIIRLDGSVTRLWESEDHPGRLLPAPDGSFIARIEVDDCEELMEGGRGTCFVDVQLIDAASGEVRGAPLHLVFGPEEGVEQLPPDWVFHPSGTLILSDGNLSYAVTPEGAATEAAGPPSCFRPRTSSSDISQEGRSVLWDRFDERLVITPPEAPGYPERCF